MNTDINNMNAADHRNAITAAREMYDTDAFATNKVHGISAEVLELRDEVDAQGGEWDFRVLTVAATGEIVAREVRQFADQYRYNSTVSVWSVDRSRFGRSTIPMGNRSRVQKSLGLVESIERAPAVVEAHDPSGTATGFGGLTSVHAWIFRADVDCLGVTALDWD